MKDFLNVFQSVFKDYINSFSSIQIFDNENRYCIKLTSVYPHKQYTAYIKKSEDFDDRLSKLKHNFEMDLKDGQKGMLF